MTDIKMRSIAINHLMVSLTLLSGCGGGGGGATSISVNDRINATPLPIYATSYENMKSMGASQFVMPIGLRESQTFAIGDFFRSGNLDLFTAKQIYDPLIQEADAVKALGDSALSIFSIWRKDSYGAYTQSMYSAKGCLHPRKALVADFNKDGYPDIFVACHGLDLPPYPGEKSKLVLSDGVGGFRVVDGTAEIGYYHGGAAGDVNGDGYPDILLSSFVNADGIATYFLLNDKKGGFVKDASLIKSTKIYNAYLTLEMIDLNSDGVLDILAGYDDSESAPGRSPTYIIYGSKDGVYNFDVGAVELPSVEGRSIVLDFTFDKSNGKRELFLTKTNGDLPSNFYSVSTVQKIDLDTLQSSVVFNQPAVSSGKEWIPTSVFWWLPDQKNGKKGISPFNNYAKYFVEN